MTEVPANLSTADWITIEVARVRVPLLRALRRRGVAETLAEDLAQEACLRAMENRSRFTSKRPLLPWLLTVASRLQVDEARRIKPRVSKADHGPLAPDELCAMREEKFLLDRALAKLSARDRGLLDAFYRRQLSIAEIAAEMKMKPGTVKSRLHRARLEAASRMGGPS